MDKKTLVDVNIIDGKLILERLDASKIDVKSAFWFFMSNINEWRLMLATPIVDKQGPKNTYTKVQKELETLNDHIKIPLESISVISPNDPLNQLLSIGLKTGPGIFDIRFTANVINGVFIEDVYIYRLN